MPAIHWAADLLKLLRGSGTGQNKLDAVKAAMVLRFNDPVHASKPADHPDRHLTAAEAVAALRAFGAGEVTLDKAGQFVETGVYKAPPPPAHPGDLLPLPPSGEAPERAAPADPGTPPVPVAGTEDLATLIPTVGPKQIPEPGTPPRPGGLPRGGRAKVVGPAPAADPAG